MMGLVVRPALADSVVVFNEVMYHPATNEPAMEWLELHNQNAVDVDLGGWRLTGGIDYLFPMGTVIRGRGYLVVAVSPAALMSATGTTNVLGPFGGRLSNNGEELRLRDNNNRLMDLLNYGVEGEWPDAPDGGGVSLAKRHPNLASRPPESWTVSRQVGGNPGTANFPIAAESVVVLTTNLTLVPFGASWRYYPSGNPGAGWNQPGFADGTWSVGPALLGFETNTLPLPLVTTLALGDSAYYFRTTFEFNGTPAGADLRLQHVVDDGLVVYLNGVEVFRNGMPEGPITHATLASRGIGDATVEGPYALPATSLVAGVNVLAVEVHQTALSSSDLVFGLRLDEQRGLGTVTNAPTVLPLTGPVTSVVPVAASWRYNEAGVDLGLAWRDLDYNDSGWGSSAALFFVGDAPLPGPKNTPLTPGRNTYYFRTTFPFTGDPAMTLLRFRGLVDDGAVFYLNGLEIHRQNMPAGAVTYATPALGPVGNADFTDPIVVPTGGLVQGLNVLAVEVHQVATATSSSGVILSGGGLALAEEGPFGGAPPMNLARQPGAAPFVIDSLSGFPIHDVAGLTDGIYGNNNSWIGNSGSPGYAGVRFGGQFAISSFAFSRDNLGTFSDRMLGTYTLQYTRVASPGQATTLTGNPDTGWAAIGALNYQSAGTGLFANPSRRHRFTFTPVNATAIRLLVPSTGIGAGTCIDEIEVNPPASSSDIAFGGELTIADILPPPPSLVFNEVSGASSNSFWLEIINTGDNAVELGGVTVTRAGAGAPGYVFALQSLAAGGIFPLTQAQLGFGAADGDKLFLHAAGGYALLDATTVKLTARARFPDGTGDWMVPTPSTPGATNVVILRSDIVINEIMYHTGELDPSPAVLSNFTLVPITGAWRYHDGGVDLGAAWRDPGYNDSVWPAGAGLLTVNAGSLPAPSNTLLAPNRSTYYFRTSFNLLQVPPNVTLDVRAIADDGAVFYLNGTEVARFNMPTGSVNYSTMALVGVPNATLAGPIGLNPGLLVVGQNVLAVELHQSSRTTNAGMNIIPVSGLTIAWDGSEGRYATSASPAPAPDNDALQTHGVQAFVTSNPGLAANVNDGRYGNSSAWSPAVGDASPAVILRFNQTIQVSSVAWSRDNGDNTDAGCAGGVCTDRALGNFTIQYTLHPDPASITLNNSNPTNGWVTLGTIQYLTVQPGFTPHLRHQFDFARTNGQPIMATGLRFRPAASHTIDEIEINPPAAATFDAAFGAELSLVTTLTPALPHRKSGEEWLELFNRSASPVDLTGWRLDAGIDFRFTNGPVIAPGGFVVVARDAAALRLKWPELTTNLVGDFSGRLEGGERFLLRDAAGNPVDETRVFEGGWSDGGGSSLELRDPDADRLSPDAWADSDESAKGTWQTVSYRMVAGQNYGSTRWNEFRIGLLDDGVVLLDDVSVVRDPDGVREQLIQNGSFTTGTGNTRWRFLGHHRGEFVPDPDNAANQVLKLTAGGRAVMNHNHVETTLLNNAALVNGQLYEVSFRGRWIAGSPQVNTRAYFSKLARTTLLPMPTRLGTPGATNSRRVNNAGPTFAGLQHAPVVPSPNQPATISVLASDPDGVASVILNYRVNPAVAFSSLPMTLQSTGAWTAAIPGQVAGRVVHFYVTAVDTLGASGFAPATGPASRALYQVADAQGTALPTHELRLIMLDADRDFMLAPTNVMSNARNGATLIYDRSEVFYDAGARLQGTAASRIRDGDNYVSYDIALPEGRLFRGVQNNIGLDRSGRGPTVRGQDEINVFQMFHRAGIPIPYHDLCYFIAPRTVHTGTAILQLAGYGNGFIEEQYDTSGTVFNMDITYEPDTLVAPADPESIKLPVPHQGHIGTDFTDLGDKEQFRSPFDIRSENRRDDYVGLMALCRVMGLPQAQFDAQIAAVLDVDEALRMAAMEILCGIGDTYINSAPGQLPHNLRLITFPNGDPAQLLAWDMDFTFSAATTSPILITSGSNLGKLMNHPATRRLYLHHINDICQSAFLPEYMNPWLSHYASVVGQNFSANSSYIASRRSYALSQLPAMVPFAITSNGGADFTVNTNFVTVAGTGWLDIRGLEVNGIPYRVTWTTITNWSITVPLGAGANLLTVLALDRNGTRLTNRTDTITVTNTVQPALVPVVINEWMADNAGPGGLADPADGLFQDWFELYNPNPIPVNLGGFHLTDNPASPTKFVIPSNTVIAAQGFLLVWADENGLQNSPTNADLHASFRLSNNGESIGLFAPDGLSPQHLVPFGPQFLNVSQGLFPDGAVGTSFLMTNWTPRAANQLGLPPAPQITGITSEPGELHFTLSAVPGRTYQVEYKDSLEAPAWLPIGSPRTATASSLVLEVPLGPEPQRFLRVRLQ